MIWMLRYYQSTPFRCRPPLPFCALFGFVLFFLPAAVDHGNSFPCRVAGRRLSREISDSGQPPFRRRRVIAAYEPVAHDADHRLRRLGIKKGVSSYLDLHQTPIPTLPFPIRQLLVALIE